MTDDSRATYTLRASREFLDRLKRSAENAGHSMNAEIINRLESNLPAESRLEDFLREEALELEMQIQAMKDERAAQSAQAMEYAKRGSDVLAGAILQMEIRSLTNRLLEAESRLRRIKRALGR